MNVGLLCMYVCTITTYIRLRCFKFQLSMIQDNVK